MKFQLLNKFLFLFVLLFFSESRAQESHLISFNNEIIHYKTFGNGKPLLIINGGPGMNCEGFENLAQEIANKGFKTIIYDQRGTGKSLLPIVDSTTITLKLMVEDIEKLRKQLKIDKWSLFGQSFGGVLVAKYAHQYPERVDKIIFSSSAGLDLKFMETINVFDLNKREYVEININDITEFGIQNWKSYRKDEKFKKFNKNGYIRTKGNEYIEILLHGYFNNPVNILKRMTNISEIF